MSSLIAASGVIVMPDLRTCLFLSLSLPATVLAAESPVVFWESDPVGPDQTVVLSGANLSGVSAVRVARLRDSASSAVGALPDVDAKIVQQTDRSLKFLLPAGIGKGVYQYALTGKGAPVKGLLNTPTVYWTQGDDGNAATPGGWLRVLGRNICRSADAVIRLNGAKGGEWNLKPASCDLWDSRVDLPKTLSPGTYSLKVWNGNGDSSGWAAAGSLTVHAPTAIPAATFNARDLGARGNDAADDTAAIQQALEKARQAGGGVVYLPRGFYRVSGPLTIPDNVALKGDGMDLTSMVWTAGDASASMKNDTGLTALGGPPPVLLSGKSNFRVEDLTLTARSHLHFLRGGFPRADGDSDGENITIRRVRIRGFNMQGHLSPADEAARMQAQLSFAKDGVDTLALAGRNLVIEDCDIYGSGRSVFLLRPVGARVTGTDFYNGRRGWYSISGPNGVIFENNRIHGADLESTGGGINTMFAGLSYAQNVLFKGNRIDATYGWDGEAMTTDGPGGLYYGKADYAVSNGQARLKLLGQAVNRPDFKDWRGAGVFVSDGRGYGEFARVVSRDGADVVLDRPFPLAIDNTSMLTVTPMQTHYLILDNTITDANIGLQLYGTAIEHVVAGNASTRTAGFVNKVLFYQGVQPSWYNQFLGNRILASSSAAPSYLMVSSDPKNKAPDMLAYGLVLRDNRLQSNASIILRGESDANPTVGNILVEGSQISNSDRGIRTEQGVTDFYLRNNAMSGVTVEVGR